MPQIGWRQGPRRDVARFGWRPVRRRRGQPLFAKPFGIVSTEPTAAPPAPPGPGDGKGGPFGPGTIGNSITEGNGSTDDFVDGEVVSVED